MDRPLLYPGALPAETDGMWVAKNCMIGLGLLYQDLIGNQTLAASLPCTPGSGLTVSIGAGRIYSLQEIDATAYSSIAADTTHSIVKQGFLKDPSVLACPAPGTFGQSINYLIEATYADVDTNLVTLPYYNAANPAIAYSGPSGLGTAQATVRSSELQLLVKAGTAAATGSQTTPAADSGYIGLYVVTVANGAASIVSGNISQISANFLPQGPYLPLSTSYVTPSALATDLSAYATLAAVASDIAPLATAASVTSLASTVAADLAAAETYAAAQASAAQSAAVSTAQTYANATQNLAANGYKKHPNGFMEAWGLMTIAASGGTAVDFLTACGAAFPAACFGVQLTTLSSSDSGAGLGVPFAYSVSAAGFSADNTAGDAINTYWHAYGH